MPAPAHGGSSTATGTRRQLIRRAVEDGLMSLITARALFWGETKKPSKLPIPVTFPALYHIAALVLVIAAVLLAGFTFNSGLKVGDDTSLVRIKKCYVSLRCPAPGFSLVRGAIRITGGSEADVDGSDVSNCDVELCVTNETREHALTFELEDSVLDLTHLPAAAVAFPVRVRMVQSATVTTAAKVLLGPQRYTELDVNITQGIVFADRTEAASGAIRVGFGAVFLSANFTGLTAANSSMQLTGVLGGLNYCVSPQASFTIGQCTTVNTTLSVAGAINATNVTTTQCPFSATVGAPACSSSSSSGSGADCNNGFTSHLSVTATSLYINTAGGIDETRVAGQGIEAASAIDPRVVALLENTARWQARQSLSFYVQVVDVLTPGFGMLFKHSSRRIMLELGPERMAFFTGFVMRPYYRRMGTALSHYGCPAGPARRYYAEPQSLVNAIGSKDLALATLERELEEYIPLTEQYALSQVVLTSVGNDNAVVAFETPAVEYKDRHSFFDTSWTTKVLDLNAEENVEISSLRFSVTTWILLACMFAAAIVVVFGLVVGLYHYRDDIAAAILIIERRSAQRSAVDGESVCPYHYFASFSTTVTWFVFRVAVHLDTSAFGTFLEHYFVSVRKEDAATGQDVQGFAFEQIKGMFERWMLLRYAVTDARDEDVAAAIDRLGGYRSTADKFVVLGLRKLPTVSLTASFELNFAALQNFYEITRDPQDSVLLDDIYFRGVIENPTLQKEDLIRQLRNWRFTVLQKPITIVHGIRPLVVSAAGLLTEEHTAHRVEEFEYMCTSWPSFAHVLRASMLPPVTRRAQLTARVKYEAGRFAESMGALILAFAPLVCVVIPQVAYEAEHVRYSTTTKIRGLPELNITLTYWLAGHVSLVMAVLVWLLQIFCVLFAVEPLLVLLTFRHTGRYGNPNLFHSALTIVRLFITVVLFAVFGASLCFNVMYIAIVLVWWVLGAIIAPNFMLVYASAAIAFITSVYSTYRYTNNLRDTAVQTLEKKILEEMLKLIRRTPAAEAMKSLQHRLGLKRQSQPGSDVTAGMLIDVTSDDPELQGKAVQQLAVALDLPDAILLMFVAFIHKKPDGVRRAVKSAFETMKIPATLTPLGTELVNIAVGLPVNPKELAHGFYALAPPKVVPMLRAHDDTLVTFLTMMLNDEVDEDILLEFVITLATGEASRALKIPRVALRQVYEVAVAVYKKRPEDALAGAADLLDTFHNFIPRDPVQLRLVATAASQAARMASDRPHHFKEAAVALVESTPKLVETPFYRMAAPLISAAEYKEAFDKGADFATDFAAMALRLMQQRFGSTRLQWNTMKSLLEVMVGNLDRYLSLPLDVPLADLFRDAHHIFVHERRLFFAAAARRAAATPDSVNATPAPAHAVDVNIGAVTDAVTGAAGAVTGAATEALRGVGVAAAARPETPQAAVPEPEEESGLAMDQDVPRHSHRRHDHWRATAKRNPVAAWIAHQWMCTVAFVTFAPELPPTHLDYAEVERSIGVPVKTLRLFADGIRMCMAFLHKVAPRLRLVHGAVAKGMVDPKGAARDLGALLEEYITKEVNEALDSSVDKEWREEVGLVMELFLFLLDALNIEDLADRLVHSDDERSSDDEDDEAAATAPRSRTRHRRAAECPTADSGKRFVPLLVLERFEQHIADKVREAIAARRTKIAGKGADRTHRIALATKKQQRQRTHTMHSALDAVLAASERELAAQLERELKAAKRKEMAARLEAQGQVPSGRGTPAFDGSASLEVVGEAIDDDDDHDSVVTVTTVTDDSASVAGSDQSTTKPEPTGENRFVGLRDAVLDAFATRASADHAKDRAVFTDDVSTAAMGIALAMIQAGVLTPQTLLGHEAKVDQRDFTEAVGVLVETYINRESASTDVTPLAHFFGTEADAVETLIDPTSLVPDIPEARGLNTVLQLLQGGDPEALLERAWETGELEPLLRGMGISDLDAAYRTLLWYASRRCQGRGDAGLLATAVAAQTQQAAGASGTTHSGRSSLRPTPSLGPADRTASAASIGGEDKARQTLRRQQTGIRDILLERLHAGTRARTEDVLVARSVINSGGGDDVGMSLAEPVSQNNLEADDRRSLAVIAECAAHGRQLQSTITRLAHELNGRRQRAEMEVRSVSGRFDNILVVDPSPIDPAVAASSSSVATPQAQEPANANAVGVPGSIGHDDDDEEEELQEMQQQGMQQQEFGAEINQIEMGDDDEEMQQQQEGGEEMVQGEQDLAVEGVDVSPLLRARRDTAEPAAAQPDSTNPEPAPKRERRRRQKGGSGEGVRGKMTALFKDLIEDNPMKALVASKGAKGGGRKAAKARKASKGSRASFHGEEEGEEEGPYTEGDFSDAEPAAEPMDREFPEIARIGRARSAEILAILRCVCPRLHAMAMATRGVSEEDTEAVDGDVADASRWLHPGLVAAYVLVDDTFDVITQDAGALEDADEMLAGAPDDSPQRQEAVLEATAAVHEARTDPTSYNKAAEAHRRLRHVGSVDGTRRQRRRMLRSTMAASGLFGSMADTAVNLGGAGGGVGVSREQETLLLEIDDTAVAQAIAAGSPFPLLRTKREDLRAAIGVLSGVVDWYPPHRPRAFWALTSVLAMGRATPSAVLPVLSSLFPLKLRSLAMELMLVQIGDPRGSLIAVADFTEADVRVLQRLRACLFPQWQDNHRLYFLAAAVRGEPLKVLMFTGAGFMNRQLLASCMIAAPAAARVWVQDVSRRLGLYTTAKLPKKLTKSVETAWNILDSTLPKLIHFMKTSRRVQDVLDRKTYIVVAGLHLLRADFHSATMALDRYTRNKPLERAASRLAILLVRIVVEEGAVRDLAAVSALLRDLTLALKDLLPEALDLVPKATDAVDPAQWRRLADFLAIAAPYIAGHLSTFIKFVADKSPKLQDTVAGARLNQVEDAAHHVARGARKAVGRLTVRNVDEAVEVVAVVLPLLCNDSKYWPLIQRSTGVLRTVLQLVTKAMNDELTVAEAVRGAVTVLNEAVRLQEELGMAVPDAFKRGLELASRFVGEHATEESVAKFVSMLEATGVRFFMELLSTVVGIADGSVAIPDAPTAAQVVDNAETAASTAQAAAGALAANEGEVAQTINSALGEVLSAETHQSVLTVVQFASGDIDALPDLLQIVGLSVDPQHVEGIKTVLRSLVAMRDVVGRNEAFVVNPNDLMELIASQIFHELDTDNSGEISFDEFLLALQRMHLELPESEARVWFADMDLEGRGVLPRANFLNAVAQVRDRFLQEVLVRLRLTKELVYFALAWFALLLALVLAFIVLGAYGFSDGAIFTACIAGAMPALTAAQSFFQDPSKVQALLRQIEEIVTDFFGRLTTKDKSRKAVH